MHASTLPRVRTSSATSPAPRVVAVLFFLSGFCSLLYQCIWLRLAFARFGVITPVMSVVIGVFMLGLGAGSWLSGKSGSLLRKRTGWSAIAFYGAAEMIIGIGAITVPHLFEWWQGLLLNAGAADSFGYMALSALGITLCVLPWAVAMGATFPYAMCFLREEIHAEERTFGFLYLANVCGAVAGVLLPVLVMVETFGFNTSLLIGAAINLLLAAFSFGWAIKLRSTPSIKEPGQHSKVAVQPRADGVFLNAVLFTTGLTSLAMEVAWTRAFTPVLGTVVYSFAWLLGTYLVATFLGSLIYRRHVKRSRILRRDTLVYLSAIAALLPVVLNDPRLNLPHPGVVALLSIFPLSAVLGYLTPLLVDDISAGNEAVAGKAYAVNILGCIIGSPLAGYALLPLLGAKLTLACLAVPLVVLAAIAFGKCPSPKRTALLTTVVLALIACGFCDSWEEGTAYKKYGSWITRDYAATTIAYGGGKWKMLLVNGIGMTALAVETAYMGYLPAVAIGHKPESALVICLGMGTTYRSLLHWGLDVTAVELIPGVKRVFPYFYADKWLWNNPRGRIVVDDGRRFLMRTPKKFDIIIIDPPPPPDASCSSLLYSEQFYGVVKKHLAPGGILQQWYPLEDGKTLPAVARSIVNSFPYVRAYYGLTRSGVHFLCSQQPIPDITTEEMIAKMPAVSKADLASWLEKETDATIEHQISRVLAQQVAVNSMLTDDTSVRITDDRPYNEYHCLRDRKLILPERQR